ncbi:MAG: alpha/beta fold hydrolase [Phycisphaerales bacterium]
MFRQSACVLAAVIVPVSLVPHAAARQGVPRYTARQFYATTAIGAPNLDGFAFSPDESSILFGSDASGCFNVYTVPVAGGKPAALTDSKADSRFAVSFFPRDGRVLFSGDTGGNELTHVYVREADGSVRDLTPGENLKAEFGSWSADGKHFFVLSNERDPRSFDLYRYAADGYARDMACQNPGGLLINGVSPDGRWVALTKERTNSDSDLYLYDTTASKQDPILITPRHGVKENIAHGFACFTPDSSAVYFQTNAGTEFDHLRSFLVAGVDKPLPGGQKNHQVVEKADWDIMYSAFAPGGQYRVTAVNADARTELTVRDAKTNQTVKLPTLPSLDITGVRFSPSGKFMAFFASSDTSPANLYVMDLKSGEYKKLTSTLNPEIKETHLVTSQVVRYKSFDGLDIPATLYRPQGASAANKAPALVWVHGGPGGQTRVGYSAQIQFLVNHGYAVLGVNNRGSSGYGKTFFHLDDKKHGEDDLQDCIHGRKYLASLDWVDGARVGIIGGSYGGYMTAAALTLEPDSFEVGIDIFGPTNWVRTLESIPAWWADFRDSLYAEMGDPATDKERLHRISPLFHAKNIKKPLMVIQGANDPRVLQRESDEIVAEARKNGVPVEYVVFPDEGHGFLRKENRIEAAEKQLVFLDNYLRGAK